VKHEVPEMVTEAGTRPRLGQALRELWVFRGTVGAFTDREVRVRYAQTLFGVGWAVLQPLALLIVLAVILGRLAGISGGGVPYPAFALSALVPWTFLQTSVSRGAGALITDAALVRKVYFPREAPVLGAVLAAAVDFGIGLALFAVVGPFLGARPSAAWLLAPVLGVVFVVMAAGVACGLAALSAYYRDFKYALPFALQLWLFASPVVYPLSVVPQGWRTWYVIANPAAGVLDGFHRTLALGDLPDPGLLALSLAGTLALAWLGYRIFKALEPNVADVL
jgi:lipopolysaccharide transport system permease protein